MPAGPGFERALIESGVVARGHFRYESGHHGDLWVDLDAWFADAARAREWSTVLARRAAELEPAIVCGPETGGAQVAATLAVELRAEPVFAERIVAPASGVRYRLPDPMRARLRDRRVLLVDDAINAGSACESTLAELRAVRRGADRPREPARAGRRRGADRGARVRAAPHARVLRARNVDARRMPAMRRRRAAERPRRRRRMTSVSQVAREARAACSTCCRATDRAVAIARHRRVSLDRSVTRSDRATPARGGPSRLTGLLLAT